jgi:hypothetical protein
MRIWSNRGGSQSRLSPPLSYRSLCLSPSPSFLPSFLPPLLDYMLATLSPFLLPLRSTLPAIPIIELTPHSALQRPSLPHLPVCPRPILILPRHGSLLLIGSHSRTERVAIVAATRKTVIGFQVPRASAVGDSDFLALGDVPRGREDHPANSPVKTVR